MTEDRVRPETFAVPEADAAEQRRSVDGEDDAHHTSQEAWDPSRPDREPIELPEELPEGVDAADAYEQTRTVGDDEDDYR